MANFERLEPRSGDMPAFEDRVDIEHESDEGSRLPLLIVIALLVLAAFSGVVWLAYTQGVERGRADAPRVVETQAGSGSSLVAKAYRQPAPPDEETQSNAGVPPLPPPLTKAQSPAPVATTAGSAGSPTKPSPSVTTPPLTAISPKERSIPAVPPATKLTAAPPPMAILPKIKPKPAARPTLASEPPPKPAPAAAASSPPLSLKTLPSETFATPVKATRAPALLGQEVSGEPAAKSVETTAAPGAPTPTAPAPTAAAVRTAAAPASPASGKGYFLQIGAYKSQDDADAAWRAFRSAHPAAAAYDSNVKAADLGDKGVWYRLRIGAFSDKDAAAAACAKLKSEGASCFPAR